MIADKYNSTAMLTTIDNPYDPFTDFEEWWLFDTTKGYNSCAYLDRIAKVNNAMSEEEANAAISDAIDEIIELNPLNIYKKVWPK